MAVQLSPDGMLVVVCEELNSDGTSSGKQVPGTSFPVPTKSGTTVNYDNTKYLKVEGVSPSVVIDANAGAQSGLQITNAIADIKTFGGYFWPLGTDPQSERHVGAMQVAATIANELYNPQYSVDPFSSVSLSMDAAGNITATATV